MIDKQHQQSVKRAWRAFKRAQEQLAKARLELVEEIYAAHEVGGATFAELAAIMRISRQRAGQYLKGVK